MGWYVADQEDGSRGGDLSSEGAKPDLTDFDRYIEEHEIPEAEWPAAFAQWIAEKTGGPVPRFEKAEREAPADGVVIEGDDL